MNPRFKSKLKMLVSGISLFLVPVSPNMAALTDLADAPVTSMTTTNVLPNLMFVLDDSGSMQQDYTPDYVNDTMCYDTLDYHSTLDNSRRPCFPGDPLFMSPDFNYQYYNPDIYYEPPVNASGTPFDTSFMANGNQNPAAAKTDPYGRQVKDMLQNSVTTVNLKANSWPDREWCSSASGGTCVTNTDATGYKYPDATYGYGFNKSGCDNYDTFFGSGSKCINYIKVAPYYWRIKDSEDCTDDEFTSCSPIGPSPAKPTNMRWCTDATLTNCQARKMGSYNYPRVIGNVVTGSAATNPTYTLTFTNVPQNKSLSYSGAYIRLTIGSNVYNFLSSSNISGSTDNDSSQTTRNNRMAAKMYGLMSNGSFSITRNNNTIIIKANTAGTSFNGGVFSLNLPANAGTITQGYTAGQPASATHRQKNYTMTRVNIISGQTYPKHPNRIDCVGAVCTYDEEIQNFANWFSYYRTRMQAMKSAVSLAFKPIDQKFRVGFNTINYTGTSNSDSRFLNINDFTSTQKSTWYQKLFGATPSGSTPLRTSLDKVGRIYSGTTGSDPVQYSCQQNFTLLTTDGYWNDSFSGFGNHDSNPSAQWSLRDDGVFDGGAATNAADTLADVAQYYFATDLRPSMVNNVPTTAVGHNLDNHQHMVTFTLGLGMNGVMKYIDNYATDTNGDFAKIKTGVACAWSGGGACNWPVPVSNGQTTIDDLWHAAVNGRGKYFSARDPAELVSGLKNALSSIQTIKGSGSAGATSTPFIVANDDFLFITTFHMDPAHLDWYGEVRAQRIDTVTGQVISGDIWAANPLLDTLFASGDGRTVKTWNGPNTAPKDFLYSMLGSEQAYFSNKGSFLGQYGILSVSDQAVLNDGNAMVNFLRGNSAGVGTVFRDRQKILGDTVHSKPVYVKVPREDFTDSGYSAFKAAQAARLGTLYVGGNDGMIHAFDGGSGVEKWAYVPRMVMPNMYLLAEKYYDTGHRFFVDGEQTVGDVKLGSNWRTILVTGMGKGARGFVALDVTDPANPIPLWEFCNDHNLCNITDTNIGYSFGNPVITKRKFDGKWVVIVTSGYNNVSPGDGKGWVYVLDAGTGAILDKQTNGSGSTGTPSGLSKINVWVDSPQYDNTGKYVYGADLNGDLWRFDLTGPSMVVLKIGSFKNSSSQIQPVTTKPELVECDGYPMVLVGTGKLLGQSDIAVTDTQSIYGVVDRSGSYPSTVHGLRDSNLIQQTTSTHANGQDLTVSNNTVNVNIGHNGWYLDLAAGERVNVDPFVALGVLAMAGNTPSSSDPCKAGGTSVFYAIAACSGGLVDPSASGTSYVAGRRDNSAMIVGLTGIQLASGNMFAIAQMSDSATKSQPLPNVQSIAGGRRVSWRELIQ